MDYHPSGLLAGFFAFCTSFQFRRDSAKTLSYILPQNAFSTYDFMRLFALQRLLRGRNQNHRLSRWFALPLQGAATCCTSRRVEQFAYRTFFSTSPKGLLAFFPSERIYVFLKTYLILGYIFLQLRTYIFFYLFRILPYCVYIVTAAPEMPVSILVL